MQIVTAFKIFLVLVLFLSPSCGSQFEVAEDNPRTTAPEPTDPIPSPEPGPDTDKISYEEASAYMDTYCGECHANIEWMNSERAMEKNKKAIHDQIKQDSMPPSYAQEELPSDIKELLLDYFK